MIGLMIPSAFAEYNEQVSVKAIFVSTIGECSDKDWIQIGYRRDIDVFVSTEMVYSVGR